jgi:hypothetical protein
LQFGVPPAAISINVLLRRQRVNQTLMMAFGYSTTFALIFVGSTISAQWQYDWAFSHYIGSVTQKHSAASCSVWCKCKATAALLACPAHCVGLSCDSNRNLQHEVTSMMTLQYCADTLLLQNTWQTPAAGLI